MWVTPSSGDGSHGGLDFASPSGCLCIPCARSCALGWYGRASKIMPPRIGMDALSDGCVPDCGRTGGTYSARFHRLKVFVLVQ